MQRVGPTETSAELDNLVENTDYFFRVLAENKMGLSAPLESEKTVKPVSPFSEWFEYYTLDIIVNFK